LEIRPAFDGNIRYSLDEIAEMIGMTNLNMSEVEQIEKSLTYAKKKLAEIRERIKELELLEEDLLSVKA
jgi:DNA-binding transcriptional MerR regulator